MKFIHIADVHLGATLDRGKHWSNDRAEDLEHSFKNIIKECEEQQIDLLLIAGDLFNAPPTLQQLKNVDFWLRRLTSTKTVIIAGNHDYIEENSPWESYEFISNTVVLPKDKPTNVFLEEYNVCITGYSYGKEQYTERILERMKPGKEGAYNILLGHGGDKEHMPFSKEKLANLGFDYVALGHIHKPAHLVKNRMAFSGSLEPLDHTETGRRGYILGTVNGENNTLIQWIPSNIRSYVNMVLELTPEISNAEIVENIEDEIVRVGDKNMYNILLKGIVDSGLQINLSALTRRYNILEIVDKTELNYDINELLTANEHNLLGRFIKALSDEEGVESEEIRSKALKYGVEALLGTGE